MTSDEYQWALSPICGVPGIKGEGGNVYPGLRLRSFFDALGDFRSEWTPQSMCGDDWAYVIGVADNHIMFHYHPVSSCMMYPLIDRDPNTPDIQPECQIRLTIAGDDLGVCGSTPAHEMAIPECVDPSTGLPVDPICPNPQLDLIPEGRRPCWYLVHDPDSFTGCRYFFDNQKLALLLKPGQVPPPGATWTAACQTSPFPPVSGHRAE